MNTIKEVKQFIKDNMGNVLRYESVRTCKVTGKILVDRSELFTVGRVATSSFEHIWNVNNEINDFTTWSLFPNRVNFIKDDNKESFSQLTETAHIINSVTIKKD